MYSSAVATLTSFSPTFSTSLSPSRRSVSAFAKEPESRALPAASTFSCHAFGISAGSCTETSANKTMDAMDNMMSLLYIKRPGILDE